MIGLSVVPYSMTTSQVMLREQTLSRREVGTEVGRSCGRVLVNLGRFRVFIVEIQESTAEQSRAGQGRGGTRTRTRTRIHTEN